MKVAEVFRVAHRGALISSTALIVAMGLPALAWAAPDAAPVAAAPAQSDADTVGEIVVTAQKREQNQQDVPISMTAVTPRLIEANRITSALDLSAVVPNLAARPSAGGSQLPAFTMRGVTSYGVVPGSDKELSLYIDGVYIGSTVGSALDLPDLAQIEVLRGPQGTLFGRNATVGAISISTRNPPDKFGLNQEFTVGDYRQFRSKTRVDFGSFGDFSASVTFVHDERRGDIYNLGHGQVITFPSGIGEPSPQTSPNYLGDKNENIVFAALKYEPNSDFKVIEKFDWTGNHYTPAGASAVGVDPALLGPAGGAYFGGILALQTTPPLFNTTGQRPAAVNNDLSLPAYARNWGDSVTAEYRATDHLSFKNIAAYRDSYVRANDQLDGLGGLYINPTIAGAFGFPASLAGSPFATYAIEQISTSKQFSEELQANYNSRWLTLTAGALYFHLKTVSGGPPGLPNDLALTILPGGMIPSTPSGTAYNKASSIAAYTQAEVHATSQIDLVGGVRVTQDKKSGSLLGIANGSFTYNNTEPSYTGGVNYKPSRDVLLYAKYSHAFVSGGAVGSFAELVYKPEKADSFEVGIKSEWLDHHLRANLSLYDVKYTDLQSAQGGITLGHPEIGLAVADQGNARAKGFEFESNLVPVKDLTFGASAGYTDLKFTSLTSTFSNGAAQEGVPLTLSNFLPTLTPKWTTDLSAEYDIATAFQGGRLSFRVDASWRSRELTDPYTVYYALHQYDSIKYSPATWLVNTRIALEHVQLPAGEGTIAFWTKNLTNAKEITFPDILGGFEAATEFQQARTIGVDFSFKY